MKYAYLILSLFLVGCSTKERVVYTKEYVEVKHQVAIVNRPVKPQLSHISLDVKDGVIILTPNDYKKLTNNVVEVLRYTKSVDSILRYYEDKLKVDE